MYFLPVLVLCLFFLIPNVSPWYLIFCFTTKIWIDRDITEKHFEFLGYNLSSDVTAFNWRAPMETSNQLWYAITKKFLCQDFNLEETAIFCSTPFISLAWVCVVGLQRYQIIGSNSRAFDRLFITNSGAKIWNEFHSKNEIAIQIF